MTTMSPFFSIFPFFWPPRSSAWPSFLSCCLSFLALPGCSRLFPCVSPVAPSAATDDAQSANAETRAIRLSDCFVHIYSHFGRASAAIPTQPGTGLLLLTRHQVVDQSTDAASRRADPGSLLPARNRADGGPGAC